MIREAKRVLTGRPGGPEPDVRYGQHAQEIPAVTVDLKATNDTRTFTDPDALFRFADDLADAAKWLKQNRPPVT